MLQLEYNRSMYGAETEKVSINCGAVDLGQVDLLVEQGLYSNRSDFFRTAIRNQLRTHDSFIQQNMTTRMISLGVVGYYRADLEELRAANKKISISMVGLVFLADDVTPELALATIDRIKVFGVFRASASVREALKDRINH